MSEVSIDLNSETVAARLGKLLNGRQAALDMQVLKDSNYYCPHGEGTLIASAITSSKIGSGELTWNTPYARRQYYELENKSKDKNPNARTKWFEEAKTNNLKNWERIAQID